MKNCFFLTNVLIVSLIIVGAPYFANASSLKSKKYDPSLINRSSIIYIFHPEDELCARDQCMNYFEWRREYSECIRKNQSIEKDMYETSAQYEARKAKASKDCELLHIENFNFRIEKDVKKLEYDADNEYFMFKLRQSTKGGYIGYRTMSEPRKYEDDSFTPKKGDKWRFHNKKNRWKLCYTAYPKDYKDLGGKRWIFIAETELHNHQYFTGSYSVVNDEPTAGTYYDEVYILIYLDSPVSEARKFSLYEDNLKFVIHGNFEISNKEHYNRKELVTFHIFKIDLVNKETNEKISSTSLHGKTIGSTEYEVPKALRE